MGISRFLMTCIPCDLLAGKGRRAVQSKFNFFWNTMELCDWSQEGDDDRVLEPVIDYLARQEDSVIFTFDDLMTELLYDLDTKQFADQCEMAQPDMDDDTFLYSRCVALINGPAYYEDVRQGRETRLWDMEFEALLYVPQRAWARKHQRSEDEYPHFAPLSFETGSNRDGWK